MGQLFSKITDSVADLDTTPVTNKTPKNKFFKKLAVDPRSPTFGDYNRTPIRLPNGNGTVAATNTPSTPMNTKENGN